MTVHDRIAIDPTVMFGKPVIRGTRVPVDLVLKKLGAGLDPSEILAQHPALSPEDLKAAIAFAADYLAHEEILLAGDDRL